MSNTAPFSPFNPWGPTYNVDISSSSQRIKLGVGWHDIRIVNDGTATVFIAFGDAAVIASPDTSIPIGSGVHEILRTEPSENDHLYVAVIGSSSSGKIYFTKGTGL